MKNKVLSVIFSVLTNMYVFIHFYCQLTFYSQLSDHFVVDRLSVVEVQILNFILMSYSSIYCAVYLIFFDIIIFLRRTIPVNIISPFMCDIKNKDH